MTEPRRLQEWLRQQLATGLPAIAGARVEGRVPMQVSLVNEFIAEALADAAAPAARDDVASPAAFDLGSVARMVRRLQVDAAPGVITLDFEAGVDD